jgi:hypothetical protein
MKRSFNESNINPGINVVQEQSNGGESNNNKTIMGKMKDMTDGGINSINIMF